MRKDPAKLKSAIRSRRRTRIRGKISGTVSRPRLSVFRSSKGVFLQLIDDTTGKTLVSVKSVPSKKETKLAEAHAAGLALAAAAKKAGITHAVFDRGGYAYHGRVQAVAEGAREGGLTI